MNEFEQKISRQSLRQIPGEWRAEILAAVNSPARREEAKTTSFLSILNHQLSTIFWPHPKAWAGLAAVWIFIFTLNFSMRDKSPMVAEKISPPSPEMVAELKKQQKLFAELIGANDWKIADRQKFSPKPRSERAEILTA
jgi:hypothetical protein